MYLARFNQEVLSQDKKSKEKVERFIVLPDGNELRRTVAQILCADGVSDLKYGFVDPETINWFDVELKFG